MRIRIRPGVLRPTRDLGWSGESPRTRELAAELSAALGVDLDAPAEPSVADVLAALPAPPCATTLPSPCDWGALPDVAALLPAGAYLAAPRAPW